MDNVQDILNLLARPVKWEYLITSSEKYLSTSEINHLNNMGKIGWELIQREKEIEKTINVTFFYWKRKI